MQDPDALLDSLVTTLRGIPALVTLLVDASKIYAYHHLYPAAVNQYQAIDSMKAGSIMLCWTGTQITGRSNGIEHLFSAYLRPMIHVGIVFQAMRDGIVTSGGQKLKLTQIVPACHPPDIRGCFARSLFITDQSSIDYHEITIALTERGADI